MSTELPWSTITLVTANFSISTVITMGSSCAASMAVKSSSENVIGGILGLLWRDLAWADWMAQRCFFPAELEHPPPAKSSVFELTSSSGGSSDTGSAMVLKTSRTRCLVQLLCLGLSLRCRVCLTGLSLRFLMVQCRLLSCRLPSPRPDRSL